MNSRLLEIRLRRAELQNRIADQRDAISNLSEHWQGAFGLADRGYSVLRYLRRQPLLTGGLVALLVARRREVRRWASMTLGLWKGYGLFRNLTNRFITAVDNTQR